MTPKPAVWKHAKMRLRQRMNEMGGLDEMDEWRAAGACAYLSSPDTSFHCFTSALSSFVEGCCAISQALMHVSATSFLASFIYPDNTPGGYV
jgi:hypothetical protein